MATVASRLTSVRKRRGGEPADKDAMWVTAPVPKEPEEVPPPAVRAQEPSTYEDAWYRILRTGTDESEPA